MDGLGRVVRTLLTSDKANTLAHEALEAQTRPWLGVVDMTPIDSGRDGNQRFAIFTFRLKNYGPSPALRASYTFQFGNTVKDREARLATTCDDAKKASTTSNPLGAMNLLSVFPGDSGATPPIRDSVYTSDPALFVAGCVAYQGQTGGVVHTTRFVYTFRQDKIKATISEFIPSGTTAN